MLGVERRDMLAGVAACARCRVVVGPDSQEEPPAFGFDLLRLSKNEASSALAFAFAFTGRMKTDGTEPGRETEAVDVGSLGEKSFLFHRHAH